MKSGRADIRKIFRADKSYGETGENADVFLL